MTDMTGQILTRGFMMLAATAATGTPVPTESPVPADVQEVVEQMNSSASAEEKTSFYWNILWHRENL